MDKMLVAQKNHVIKLQRDAILEVKRLVGAIKNPYYFKERCGMWVTSSMLPVICGHEIVSRFKLINDGEAELK